jgi:phosphoribosyl 1,2-cyclic phosphodiesterase
LKIKSFGSSSSGNAYLLDDGASVLLIECGFTFKNLVKMIREAEYSVSQLAGVLISHEHSDHAACWDKLVDYGLKVYASDGTIGALAKKNPGYAQRMIPLAPEPGQDVSAPTSIGSFDVLAFRTFHDAAEPVGFLIRSREDREKLVFATDTVNLRYHFPGVTKMMLEANYSEALVDPNSRVPESVVKRIRNTHMELDTLCEYLRGQNLSECREIYLMHLSDHSSSEYIFYHKVKDAVPGHVKVYIFPKGGPQKRRK